jgi:hypothetical protein
MLIFGCLSGDPKMEMPFQLTHQSLIDRLPMAAYAVRAPDGVLIWFNAEAAASCSIDKPRLFRRKRNRAPTRASKSLMSSSRSCVMTPPSW